MLLGLQPPWLKLQLLYEVASRGRMLMLLLMVDVFSCLMFKHPHLVDDGVQGAEQQEAPSPDQVLSQSHHVALLLVFLPCLRSLGHRTA